MRGGSVVQRVSAGSRAPGAASALSWRRPAAITTVRRAAAHRVGAGAGPPAALPSKKATDLSSDPPAPGGSHRPTASPAR
ncbi:hypothetical protein F0344_32100 [Streptomyces finlayi]|uniref:Uncharacterized protein n=1 Tax=Streptomyces finlayi TaxID=67296 RepID=A0A7G7BTG2_9ACTN|nr:hypothetical protein [Streptomyces finlayi]QNE78627.1 hypothetical protein F0344_32100 [Streptomyces finlayi]